MTGSARNSTSVDAAHEPAAVNRVPIWPAMPFGSRWPNVWSPSMRTNRGLSYRMFGEIAEPVDGPDDRRLPAGVKVRDVLASRLRLTAGEVKRRFRVASRIRAATVADRAALSRRSCRAGRRGGGRRGRRGSHRRGVPSAGRAAGLGIAGRQGQRPSEHWFAMPGNRIRSSSPRSAQTIADCLNPDGNFTDEDRARRRGLALGRQGPDGMSRLTRAGLIRRARSYLEAVTAAATARADISPTAPTSGTRRTSRAALPRRGSNWR